MASVDEEKVISGDRIMVYWGGSQRWFHAEVISCDLETDLCEVVYDDGERESFNLKDVRYKRDGEWKGRLRRCSPTEHFHSVAKLLFDIEDRLPMEGVKTRSNGWWEAWRFKISDAARAPPQLATLIDGVLQLAHQLRRKVLNSGWKSEKKRWKVGVKNSKTAADLESCVNEIMRKGIDWKRARELFSAGRTHPGGGEDLGKNSSITEAVTEEKKVSLHRRRRKRRKISKADDNIKPEIIGKSSKKVCTDDTEIDQRCTVCKFDGDAEILVQCDECDKNFHSFCITPPLQTSVTDGHWLCHCCSTKSSKLPSPNQIDGIIGRRHAQHKLQYLVKWKSLSHHHDTWVPEEWLTWKDRSRLLAFERNHSEDDTFIDERKAEYLVVDRIIASNESKYLVKWMNLGYEEVTWEIETKKKDMQNAIKSYIYSHSKSKERLLSETQALTVVANIKKQPKYLCGGVLHSYQLQGLKWLLTNYLHRRCVILADEMGLGKTIQAVSFLVCLKKERLCNKPFLIVTPKSTLPGWEKELRQWAPGLNCIIYQGSKEARAVIQKHELFTNIKSPLFDVLVTSYELASLDSNVLQKFHWASILVDEGHRVKNFYSKCGILLRQKQSDFRVLLTGTPLQNNLTELFSLLHFVDPDEFPDPQRAAEDFRQVEGRKGRGRGRGIEEEISRLHQLLRPRMLRRTKSEVLKGTLPGKKVVQVTCALTPFQRRLYVAVLGRNHEALNGGASHGCKRSLNNILTDLKMCCNHPYLLLKQEPPSGSPEEEFKLLVKVSGKLQFLEKILPRLKAGGHRVLIFSQMTKLLDLLEDFVTFLGYSFSRIDGSTSSSERQSLMEDFNRDNNNTFIFLISTRAGGLGINLQSADTVIIYGKEYPESFRNIFRIFPEYCRNLSRMLRNLCGGADPDHNPFMDLQAQARAHRIGQVKPVLVYQLSTKFSIEEKILQRSKRKLAMENAVMPSPHEEEEEMQTSSHTLSALLLHGARKILNQHDIEATSVTFSDEDITRLLDRRMGKDGDPIDGCGYFGGAGSSDDVEDVEDVAAAWNELLQHMTKKSSDGDEELGRGMRSRKDVEYSCGHYSGDEDDDDDYFYSPSPSLPSSASEEDDDA